MLPKLRRMRTFVWHLRSGGYGQVKTWLQREAAEAGHRRLETIRGAEGAWAGRGKRRRLRFNAAQLPDVSGMPRTARAAVVLDDFSANAFAAEWDCVSLTPKNWRMVLQSSPVDFLFVESAWAGPGRQWAGKIAGTDHASLRELVEWCRSQNIPTVFWSKEDPPHYDDFLEAARLFDHVFTTDVNRLPDYLRDLGHSSVSVLPFAAQPFLHNPIRPEQGWHQRDIAFGGMYFTHKFPERRAQLDMLLGAAADVSAVMETGLEIFSRQLGGDERYQFPKTFVKYVVGSLSYMEMVTAYKAYKIFLNVNSVVDSPSMCSRRVFEIIASGSNVVTTTSAAIERYFEADEICGARSQREAADVMKALVRNPELGQRLLHRGQRKIWREHTYRHRSNQILATAVPHLAPEIRRPSVSALVSTMRAHQLDHVFRTIGSQVDVAVELVLLTHGFTLEPGRLEQLKSEHGVDRVSVLSAPPTLPLGDCLNRCVAAASGDVLTKMDDDDSYGPNYLSDQLYALDYSRADVVGKQAHYMYLSGREATILRFPHKEHRWTRTVMGPTIMARKSVFLEHPFEPVASGEDTKFLASVSAHGGTIYSSDRFNYRQQRNAGGHTWRVTEDELLASGDLKFFGKSEDSIFI